MTHDYQRFEERFLRTLATTVEKSLKHNPFNFLGVVYIGPFGPTGRRQNVTLSADSVRLLGYGDKSAADKRVDAIVQTYLHYLGTANSINALILRRRLPCDSRVVRISLNTTETNDIVRSDIADSIFLSRSLCEQLGVSEGLWKEIALSANGDLTSARTKLSLMKKRVTAAVNTLEMSDHAFFHRFGSYVLSDDESQLPEKFKEITEWLLAIQALSLFQWWAGPHWTSIPIHLSNEDDGSLLPAPLGAVTGIGSELNDPMLLVEVKDKLERKVQGSSNTQTPWTILKRENSKRLQDIEDVIGADLAKKIGFRSENLRKVLRLAERLVGSTHEGKPLTFVLICASPTNLARPIGQPGTAWSLRSIDGFKTTGIPTGPGPEDELESVRCAVNSNELILQEPGAALYFSPVGDFRPLHVVHFTPSDAKELENVLKALTTVDRSAVTLHVMPNGIRLFSRGIRLAWFDGKNWTAVQSLHGEESGLIASIRALRWWTKIDNRQKESVTKLLQRLVDAIEHIAARAYGALFFLSAQPKSPKPMRTAMGPVWLSASQTINDLQADDIAGVAGLDGETFVNVFSGALAARQFVNVDDDDFVEVFTTPSADNLPTTLSRVLRRDWEREQTKFKDQFLQHHGVVIQDKVDSLYNFGTRHLKALRVTRAHTHIIAVTVSSSGPIRLWHKGIPVRKFIV